MSIQESMSAAAERAAAQLPLRVKPRLRGVLHKYSLFVALGAGTMLILGAPTSRARVAALIYAVALCGLLTASTLYHRVNWSPRARRWMRRVDHSMIFVLIAGTYTPFALLVADGFRAVAVLVAVWVTAVSGALVKVAWADGPKWTTVLIGAALGWITVATTPDLALRAGMMAAILVLTGGLLYTAGAVIYAVRRPDPVPAVFGYHEIFHTLVIAAAAAHFVAIAFYVLPRG